MLRLSDDKKYICFDKEDIKKIKKISGHAFVEIAGLNHFNPKGDAVLGLFGFYKNDVDKKYLYRGDLAEKIVQKVYSRTTKIQVYDKKSINYDNFQDNKYFGGLIDIELPFDKAYVEVKSKSMSAYDSVNNYPPMDEVYQGLLYCVLGHKDKLIMEWIFFDEKAEQEIFNGMQPSSLKELKKITKEYLVKDYEEDVRNKMKETFNYYLNCYKESRVPVNDISERVLKILGFDVKPNPFGEFSEEDLPF